jgi:pyruvate formate-lyase activating enzyme-like uncharacterized protein
MKVAGVIYLLPIYPHRYTGTSKASLKAFQTLCGEGLDRVRMVTTGWSLCPNEQVGRERENELKKNFWKEMMDRGSTLSRLENNSESAMCVLESVLEHALQLP